MEIELGWDGGNQRDERDYDAIAPGFDTSKWFPFKTRGDAELWMYFCAHSPAYEAFDTMIKMWKGTGEDRVTFKTAVGMIKYMRRVLPLLEVHTHSVRNAVKVRKKKKGKKLHGDDREYEYRQV
jgi:hypothetical protein